MTSSPARNSAPPRFLVPRPRRESSPNSSFIDRLDAQQRRVRLRASRHPVSSAFSTARFCNANKFAGERDLFEALNDIKEHYNIDAQRLVVRGFSMGGARRAGNSPRIIPECGRPLRRARASRRRRSSSRSSPKARRRRRGGSRCSGAGMTARRWPRTSPTRASSPTPARSTAEKQAADIMVKYAKQEGIEFPHIIGPQTARTNIIRSRSRRLRSSSTAR